MTTEMHNNIKIGFWGGPEYSVLVLEKLFKAGYTISFVCTSLDKPKGRGLELTPPPAKVWALAHNIPVIQPTDVKSEEFKSVLKEYGADVFVVMAFGKIIPEDVLNIPKGKSLNIHPSLLPKFRGPSPIESAILADEKETGVTVMQMDKEMDHGPIVAAEKVVLTPWPPLARELGVTLVNKGADLLVSILPDWMNGKIKGSEQDHSAATYSKKFIKEDGLIDLTGDAYANYLKIQAYHAWPVAYFLKNEKRVKITSAKYENGKLVIEKVIPEGKGEMSYDAFLKTN